ncbi:MAG: hypothetical protein LC126_27440 [Bryobacterales bacterium]|nr:hypothetical protein [Bryobacterales bacterium]
MKLAVLFPCLLLPLLLGAQTPKLTIISPAFHQFEDGPPMPANPFFVAGETLFFSCRVTGYKAGEKETMGIEWKIEPLDDQNVALAKPETKSLETDLAPEDRDWKPIIRYQLVTPYSALCRRCRIRIDVKDRLSGQTAAAEFPFSIHGKAVEPSETLTVRNFRFLRSETDETPLAVPAYRPGDQLWARFEMTGYRFGEGNSIHVEYGISVYRPSGKLLYEEPKAAETEERSFYPKRFIPGVLNLRLQGLPAGEYPILLVVKDLAGNQKFEAKYSFRVE